jgi:hypothetical protein
MTTKTDSTAIHGIPTKLNGIRFRSRLEARWASVFTLLGWRWEYEPVDLRGYVPDFVLLFKAGPVLAEVKPGHSLEELAPYTEKINASGWETKNSNEAVIVGATWNLDPTGHYWCPLIGLLRQRYPDTVDFNKLAPWWDGALVHYCTEGKHPSIHHANGIFNCTVCNAYDGDYLGDLGGHGERSLQEIWTEAGNIVQWQG